MKYVSWRQWQDKASIQVAVLAALLVCIVALGIPEKVSAPPDIAHRVLLADFVNETADPALGTMLGQVLKLSLEQSPDLLLYPDEEIQDSLRQMVLNPFAPVTADLARQICVTERIPGFLLPRVLQLSRSYFLDLRVATIENGRLKESLADTMRAEDEAELVSDVESMGRKIRQLLGEDRHSLAVTDKPLFPRGAGVPRAMKLLTEAACYHARSEYAQEIPRLESATVLDPGFALAQGRLAAAYAYLGWTVPALDHASLAESNARETPPRERYQTLGTYYLLKDDWPQALNQYQALATLYPRFWEAQLMLGDAALLSGDVARAISSYQEAIRLNQRQPDPWAHLCMAQLSNGNAVAARQAWQQALALAPESPEVIATGGFLDLSENDLGTATRAFQKIAANSDPIIRARGLFLLAQTEIYGGRMQAALALLQSGIEQDRRQRYSFFEADKRLSRAQIYLLRGDTASAASECRLVPDLHGDATRMGTLGRTLARAGQPAEAALIAAQIEQEPSSPLNKFQAGMLRGEVALASGRPEEAIRVLRQLQQAHPAATAQESLARALVAGGHWQEAEIEYHKLSERQADVLFPHESAWFMGAWAQVLFGHATCLARLGKKDEARQQYRSYLWVFDGADGDIASLREARAFLRKRI